MVTARSAQIEGGHGEVFTSLTQLDTSDHIVKGLILIGPSTLEPPDQGAVPLM
jgi:hypothetical protein